MDAASASYLLKDLHTQVCAASAVFILILLCGSPRRPACRVRGGGTASGWCGPRRTTPCRRCTRSSNPRDARHFHSIEGRRYTTNYLKHSKSQCIRHFFSGLQWERVAKGVARHPPDKVGKLDFQKKRFAMEGRPLSGDGSHQGRQENKGLRVQRAKKRFKQWLQSKQ